MPELLTLSRAARLVGIARGTLQQQIRTGDLPTFEGKITITDLLRFYPDTNIDDTSMLDRVEKIKAEAKPGTGRDREFTLSFPHPEVLTARLTTLTQELVKVKSELQRYVKLFETFSQKWEDTVKNHDLPSPLRDLVNGFQKELHQPSPQLSSEAQLLAKDTALRILAAHVQLTPSNHEFWVEGNDSILESALRAGLALNYGCSSGNCGLCKARIVSGELRKIRHHDYVLSEVEQRLGYRLMCSHTAVTDVVLEATEAHRATDIPLQQIEVKVKKLEYLNDHLLLLSVQTPRTQTLRFLAGQTAKLTYQGHTADYFIASCPCDGRNLQFHLSRLPNHPFVETVFTSVKLDHTLLLEGPQGNFVLTEDSTHPTLFLAYGYGFAPVQSLITQAMALDTVESLHLYWITSPAEGHYLSNLCRSWADALDHFHYTLFSVETGNQTQVEQLLGRVVKNHHADLSNMDVYIAGPEFFVTLADCCFRQYHLPEAQLHLGYVK